MNTEEKLQRDQLIHSAEYLRNKLDRARDLLARVKLLKRAEPGMTIKQIEDKRNIWFKDVDTFLKEVQ